MNTSWQPSSIYYLLQWVKEWIIAIMIILILIGWIVITLRFMTRPLRYLDELVDASEKLANPGEEPIWLSKAMKSVEDELNLAPSLPSIQIYTITRNKVIIFKCMCYNSVII